MYREATVLTTSVQGLCEYVCNMCVPCVVAVVQCVTNSKLCNFAKLPPGTFLVTSKESLQMAQSECCLLVASFGYRSHNTVLSVNYMQAVSHHWLCAGASITDCCGAIVHQSWGSFQKTSMFKGHTSLSALCMWWQNISSKFLKQ